MWPLSRTTRCQWKRRRRPQRWIEPIGRAWLPDYEPVFGNHMLTSGSIGIAAGILTDAAEAAGEPGLVTELIGAAGDVRSAQYAPALYDVALVARRSDAVGAAFNEGIPGLYGRLQGLAAAEEFMQAFGAFIDEHGHRGPNDWDIAGRTWESNPELALPVCIVGIAVCQAFENG